MAREDLDLGALNHALSSAQISKDKEPAAPSYEDDADGLQITCFTEVVNDTTFHFQIMRLPKQVIFLTLLPLSIQFFFLKFLAVLMLNWTAQVEIEQENSLNL